MDTHSRIQEVTNNSDIENLRNKGHAKISEFTVFRLIYHNPTVPDLETIDLQYIVTLVATSRYACTISAFTFLLSDSALVSRFFKCLLSFSDRQYLGNRAIICRWILARWPRNSIVDGSGSSNSLDASEVLRIVLKI